eukprot:scaffold1034_cov175-Ochromonas_danica.AAC.22
MHVSKGNAMQCKRRRGKKKKKKKTNIEQHPRQHKTTKTRRRIEDNYRNQKGNGIVYTRHSMYI